MRSLQVRNSVIVITDSGHRDHGDFGIVITDFGIVITDFGIVITTAA
jgi:hypothetical protein